MPPGWRVAWTERVPRRNSSVASGRASAGRPPYAGGMGELIPLFPLGTPLFPGVVLPLQIFEPRYRRLMHDLLALPEAGDRRVFCGGAPPRRRGGGGGAPARAPSGLRCPPRVPA